jgi:lactoylglutathione lyase
MLQGLRTVIYGVSDIGKAKKWYAKALGIKPYFDEPFYVGFNVGGYELGLDPNAKPVTSGSAGVVAYWGVENIEADFNRLVELGASKHGEIQEVGGGIQVATVLDPFGNILGLIYNPHFNIGENRQN